MEENYYVIEPNGDILVIPTNNFKNILEVEEAYPGCFGIFDSFEVMNNFFNSLDMSIKELKQDQNINTSN